MESQSWNVDVDGVTRTIVAESDEGTGRTTIRVDGRMVARPMAAHEEERTFTVGTVSYILRRTPEGVLDLDLAPHQPVVPQAASAPPSRSGPASGGSQKRRGVPVFRILAGIVVSAVIVVAINYGNRVWTFMNVPWKSYTHPDKMFRINFAGEPEKSSEYLATDVGVVRLVQLKSKYENHYYVLEYIELPREIPREAEGKLQQSVLEEMIQKNKWTLLKSDFSSNALTYVAQVTKSDEWSEGSMRGNILVDRRRLYIVYGFTPRGEALSWDVGEFLRSLELPN